MREEINALKEQGLYATIRTISSPQGATLVVDGKAVLNFCSNNYLGLANHEALKAQAIKAVQQYGVGPGAVRQIAGTTDLHLRLEQRLAAFKGVEAALTLQSGYTANLATVAGLMGKEDVVFSDELNHASIIDGCRLSGARVVRYLHNNIDDLRRVIGETSGYRRGMIISDGVFSMDGDLAPLPQLVEVAEQYNLLLMIDDAHGEGVVGRGGRGIVDHFAMQGRVDVEIGTLSKAFGVMGGYVAGRKEIIEWLCQRGRPFTFSSAATAADVAACLAAVDILEASTDLVDRLWANTRFFKGEMLRMGFNIGHSQTPITPVMLGEAPLAQAFSRRLFDEGVFAGAIGYPIVAKGKARIRVMISAAHSQDDLERGLAAFENVGKELGALG
ncbi:MAG: glycine C-acetyltransferase [Chloroflexi bacterium]|nr:glycine C-acetyltransferase [Chloroflexota bacterium]